MFVCLCPGVDHITAATIDTIGFSYPTWRSLYNVVLLVTLNEHMVDVSVTTDDVVTLVARASRGGHCILTHIS